MTRKPFALLASFVLASAWLSACETDDPPLDVKGTGGTTSPPITGTGGTPAVPDGGPLDVVSLDGGGGDGGLVEAGAPDAAPPVYSIGSVVLNPDGSRKTYVQTLLSLDVQSIDNKNAIEIAGNGTHLVANGHVYVGLAEEPTIKRYTPDANGKLAETGKLSFLNLGWEGAPYGNAIATPTRAYGIGDHLIAVWDPTKMEIVTTIDLSAFKKDPYDAEFWTTVEQDGRLYVPIRYADWKMGAIDKTVTLLILDVASNAILGIARDTRCHSGGRPIFAPSGDLYVVADGRNYSAQMYAAAAGKPLPANCILRIKKGALTFDQSFIVELPKLTGGYEVATEIEPAAQGTGVGFIKMFYPEKLPVGVTVATDFKFWGSPAFRYWRIEFGDLPKAAPVDGVPYSALSFGGSALEGKLYVGEGMDHASQVVYEIDPATATATKRFTIQGNLYGLHRVR